MRTFVSLLNIEDESQIDAAVEELLQSLGGDTAPDDPEGPDPEAPEPVAKHTPGGVDHDQSKHGSWATGSGSDSKKGRSSTPDPVSGKTPSSGPPAPTAVAGPPATNNRPSVKGMPNLSPAKKPAEDPEFIKSVHDKYLAEAGQRLAQIEAEAGHSQISTPTKQGSDTMGMYGVWENGEFKRYTKERSTWQSETLAKMQQEQVEANGRLPKQERQAVMMAGLPGAGKTHLIQTDLASIVDPRDYVTINADDIKEHIINDDHPPQIADFEGMELSSMVHEESSTMRKAWENTAMASGTNMILDVTGASRGSTTKLLQQLNDAGYEVTMVHADVTLEEAKASTLRRAVVNGQNGKLDRIVPTSFLEGMRGEGGDDVIDNNFNEYLPYTTRAFWYRTFPLNVERPPNERKPSELLWSG